MNQNVRTTDNVTFNQVTANLIGNATTATTATYINVQDTRASATTPQTMNANQGVRFDFKQNSTNGLSDGGTYNGVMYFRKYGSTSDWSGGGANELGFTDNGNMWLRYGTGTSWGAWKRIMDTTSYAFAANMNQNVRTTDNVTFNQVTTTGGGNAGAYYLSDTNAGLYRDNTYDVVLLQNNSSGNPLYLAGAGEVRVSIDANNNETGQKFIVGSNAIKSSNELFSVNESGDGYFAGTSVNIAGGGDTTLSIFSRQAIGRYSGWDGNTLYLNGYGGFTNGVSVGSPGATSVPFYVYGGIAVFNGVSAISSGRVSIRAGGSGGVGWGTGLNIGDSSNYTGFIQDAGISRLRNFGAGGFDWFNNGASQIMVLSNGGDLTIASNMYAYRWFDRDNTAYNINGDSISTLYQLRLGGTIPYNDSNGSRFFGMFVPDGKYQTRNWHAGDGAFVWDGMQYVTGITDSPIGSYSHRGTGGWQGWRQNGWVPIDRTKTYKVSAWVRTVSGNPFCYLSFTQAGYDYSQPDNGGWGQPYYWYGVAPSSWTEYTMTIGPAGSGADYSWYGYARFMQLGFLHNYLYSGYSGTAEFIGFKIEEVDNTLAANTTVLGDITANRFIDRNDGSFLADPTGTSRFVNLTLTGQLNIPNNALINVNNEPDVWGARFRTTTSTSNLGSALKNIIWTGGGSSEGFAVSGVGVGGYALEVRNDGIAWARSSFRAPELYTDRFYDDDGTFGFRFGSGTGVTRHINMSSGTGDPSNPGGQFGGISWGQRGDNNPYYLMYVKSPYNNGYSTYTRLSLGWHTGLELGGNASYGGTTIFNDSPGVTSTILMSIGRGDQHVRISNNLYLPYIQDSTDGSYYLDFNSTSRLNELILNSYHIQNNDGGTFLVSNTSEANNWIFQENARGWGIFYFNKGSQSGQTYGTYSTVGAETFFVGQSNGPSMPGWVGYNGSSRIAAMISHYTGYIWSNSTIYAAGEMRAPIFYDANDANYYVDPNSSSRLWYLGVGYEAPEKRFHVIGDHGSSSMRLTIPAAYNGTGQRISMQWWVSEPGNTWNGGGFGYNVDNNLNSGGGAYYFGRPNTNYGQGYIRFSEGGDMYFYNTNTSGNRVTNMEMYPSNYVYVNNYLQAGNSLRAPIFYDSNDTGYYLDPATATNVDLRMRGGTLHGPNWTWGAYMYVGTNGRPGGEASVVTTNGNLHLDCQNGYETYINHYSGNRTYLYEIRTNFIYDRDDTTFYLDPSGDTRIRNLYIWYGNSIIHYGYNNSGAYAMNNNSTYWGLMLNVSANDWRLGWGGTGSIVGWNLRWDNGSTVWANGSFRAPIFYDSDDTYWYIDPSTSGTSANFRGAVRITDYFSPNGYPNWSDVAWIGRYDQTQGSYPMYSPGAMWGIHFQRSSDGASIGMVTRGGSYNDYNLVVNWGDDSGDILEYRFNNSRVALMDIGGQAQFPIIYDYNNTGYYLDPNGTTYIENLYSRWWEPIGVGGNSGNGTHAYRIFQEGGGWGYPYPDLRIAFHTGIKLGANGPSYEGVRLYSDYDMSGILIQLSGPSNYSFWHTWQRLEGYHGIYSGINSAHIYPNNSTYGQWRIDGSRNGYGGILIDVGNTPVLMFDGGGNGGIYYQAGRWMFYHYWPYNCVGVGTSATSPSYGMYVNRGIYATENIVAYSDRRAKENIVTIDSALNKLLQIRGVYYNRIKDETKKRQIGVIAQEVNEVIPEVVTYCDVNDEYGVAYGNFAGLFIESIKDQQNIINKQAEEISTLKEELQKLKELILNNKG